MKYKILIIIGIFILVAIIAAGFLISAGEKDMWICSAGQWVKQGRPQTPKPGGICLESGEVRINGLVMESLPENSALNLENPAALKWQRLEGNFPFSGRDSHAFFTFKNKLWLMGGLNANNAVVSKGNVQYWKAKHYSDIWNSEDGSNWQKVTDKAAWGERRSVSVEIIKDGLLLFGGWSPDRGYKYSNTIWFSANGSNWQKLASDVAWKGREGHASAVFKNKLWLFGGVNFDESESKNDIWYSENGIDWKKAASSAPWAERYDHSVTVFKDRLWLAGGTIIGEKFFNDLWVSDDGINWQLVTDSPPWPARHGAAMLVYGGKLWLIGGWGKNGGMNDTWYSDDGHNWKKAGQNAGWIGREDLGVSVFQNKLWLAGGMDENWTWPEGVWFSGL